MKKLLVLFSLTTSQLFAASVGYWQIPLNLNASQLTSGTVPTNVLSGALPTLSMWNGGGSLTNIAGFAEYWFTNFTYASITTNVTVPSWARFTKIELQGSGGGGGSGGCFPAGTGSSGGGGGSGGATSDNLYDLAVLGSPTNIVIILGARGQGGASQITNNSSGLNGADGGSSAITLTNSAAGVILWAGGGGGGGGGSSTTGTANSGNRGLGLISGGLSAAGDDAAVPTVSATSGIGSGGGGGGGGVTSGDVPNNGGPAGYAAYGLVGQFHTTINGGTAPGGAGSNAVAYFFPVRGRGGSGGAGGTNVIGGAGGHGRFGGGGGGGGGGRDGYFSGAGGDGGGSYARIIFWQ